MAIPFLNDINLNQCELLNGVIHKSTSATRPVNPVDGQVTFDTDSRTFLIYNTTASEWQSVSDQDAVLSIVGTSPIQASEDGNRQVTISIDDATGGVSPTKGAIALGGDLNGTGTSASAPVVAGVGYGTADATTAAEIRGAVDQAHDQNTDTGTTSATFKLDSAVTGTTLKSVANGLEVRNSTDSGYANLRVNDLHVNGDLTYIHSTDVYLGDSFITLNAQVMNSTSNTSGGVDVKRLLADEVGTGTVSGTTNVITGSGTTFTADLSVGDVLIVGSERRTVTKIVSDTSLEIDSAFDTAPSASAYSFANQANARIFFDHSAGIWKVIDGATTSLQTFPLVRKFSATIGDGTNTSYVITHNLNTQDVTVAVRYTASDYRAVMTDWKATSVNTITVRFKKAPTSNEFRVVITG